MNLLGKTLVVFVALASIGLMFMSIMVYSTHTNWQQEAEALKTQLANMRNENEALKSSYAIKTSRLEGEAQAALQDVAKLETERTALITQASEIQKDLDRLRQEERGNKALVAATEQNNNRLQEEVAKLRAEIRQNQEDRDSFFAKALQATSQLHATVGELEQTKERNAQLAEQVGLAKSALREGGIDDAGAVVPRVRGLVSATLRDTSGLLIEITIGADDGIRTGHTVEVFRGDKYLGRAQILKTDPDRAVARVLRKFQVGPIEEGDDVATKLRVG